ncbi:MAG TPA: hypothetical protein VKY19_03930 [Ktedonosporobacter sp.]|nr:hypothetical protein [Ktedonosporobacter sp.]
MNRGATEPPSYRLPWCAISRSILNIGVDLIEAEANALTTDSAGLRGDNTLHLVQGYLLL